MDRHPEPQQNGRAERGLRAPGQQPPTLPSLLPNHPSTSTGDHQQQLINCHAGGDPSSGQISPFPLIEQQLNGHHASGVQPSGDIPAILPASNQQPTPSLSDSDLLFQCLQVMIGIVQQRSGLNTWEEFRSHADDGTFSQARDTSAHSALHRIHRPTKQCWRRTTPSEPEIMRFHPQPPCVVSKCSPFAGRSAISFVPESQVPQQALPQLLQQHGSQALQPSAAKVAATSGNATQQAEFSQQFRNPSSYVHRRLDYSTNLLQGVHRPPGTLKQPTGTRSADSSGSSGPNDSVVGSQTEQNIKQSDSGGHTRSTNLRDKHPGIHHVRPEEDCINSHITLRAVIRSVTPGTVNVLPSNFRVVTRSTPAVPNLRIFWHVIKGWPHSTPTEPEVGRFPHWQQPPCVGNGCLLFVGRLTIPSQCQMRCLDQHHRGHPSAQRMKAIACNIHRPSLDDVIKRYTEACIHCASVAESSPRPPPVPWIEASVYAGPIEGDHHSTVVACLITPARFALQYGPVRLGNDILPVDDSSPCATNSNQRGTTALYHQQLRAAKKFREGRGAINDTSDALTYRRTSAPEIRSSSSTKASSAIRFGPQNQTRFKFLRSPSGPTSSAQPDATTKRGSLDRGDAGQAQLHCVWFNVWVEDCYILRSSIHPLGSCVAPPPTTGQSSIPANNHLHLIVGLDVWQLPRPPQQQSGSSPELIMAGAVLHIFSAVDPHISHQSGSMLTTEPVVDQPWCSS